MLGLKVHQATVRACVATSQPDIKHTARYLIIHNLDSDCAYMELYVLNRSHNQVLMSCDALERCLAVKSQSAQD